MTITKQEFLSEIKLIGGRGYGIFIETDSRRHRVETGDKILEVSSHTVTPSTGSSNISVLGSSNISVLGSSNISVSALFHTYHL